MDKKPDELIDITPILPRVGVILPQGNDEELIAHIKAGKMPLSVLIEALIQHIEWLRTQYDKHEEEIHNLQSKVKNEV